MYHTVPVGVVVEDNKAVGVLVEDKKTVGLVVEDNKAVVVEDKLQGRWVFVGVMVAAAAAAAAGMALVQDVFDFEVDMFEVPEDVQVVVDKFLVVD